MHTIHPDLALVGGSTERVTLNYVETWADLGDLDVWVHERSMSILGIDTEATGLDHYAPDYEVRTVQLADADTSWVVPIDGEFAALKPRLAEIIRGHGYWTAHNAQYDIRALLVGLPEAVNVDYRKAHIADNMVVLAHYEPRTVVTRNVKEGIDPRIPMLAGLKENATRLITPDLAAVEHAMHEQWRTTAPKGQRTPAKYKAWGFRNTDWREEIPLTYAGLDPLVTVRLWQLMQAEVERTGRWELAKSDLWLQWVVDLTMARGMGVDPDYVARVSASLRRIEADGLAELAPYGITSVSKPPEIARAFLSLGVESPKQTKGGAPSFDKTVLSELAKQDDSAGQMAKTIQSTRRAIKFHSAYIDPMLLAAERDCIVRPTMRASGTTTGRMSARQPPVQQMPKKDTRVRAAFVAPPGHVLISCDFGQVEPRSIAAMSGDKAMQAAVMAGDLNSDLAELVFGDLFDRTQIDDVTSKSYAMRQSVKTGFLGWCYGAGSRKVAESIGLPEEQGQAIVDRWVRAFPDMGRYKDDLNQERMVILPSGRWCPLWDRYTVGPEGELVLRPRPSRCGLNYMTQGSARDLLATAIHRFIAMNPDYGHYLWNFVHDEVLICVPAERAEEVGNALAKAMTFRLHGVPIEAEPEVLGQRWGKVPAELVITEDDEELELVAA